MTVLEAIQRSAEFLGKKGVDSPRLQSELLLAHVLKLPRLKLYLEFERKLAEAETDALREAVKRRGAREPLQHILGNTCFCGLDIAVNYNVLIPRPETELLAELAWKFLNQMPDEQPRFLDFGTGSGCIAIAVCQFAPKVRGVALDKSADALAVARENAAKNGVSDRIEFLQSDGFASLAPNHRFQLIVSNPPYIPAPEIATLQEEVRKYDPHAALDGGADGLDFYRLLAHEAPSFLEPGGKFMAEFGEGQAAAISKIFAERGWTVEQIVKDFTDRERFIVASREAA